MWVATYEDGGKLAQYDLKTFKDRSFNDIDQNRLIKFGLYPYSKELANALNKEGHKVASLPFLPSYEVNIDKNRRLIHYRDVFISHEEYHLCRKCGKEFTLTPTTPKVESRYPSPICPHCGGHDIFKCKSCGNIYQKFEDAPGHMCKCKGHLERIRLTSGKNTKEKRWIEYYLGYQETTEGKNNKILLKIKENGDSEIM
jgi:hypothetical protein